jgi:hypothetical protein
MQNFPNIRIAMQIVICNIASYITLRQDATMDVADKSGGALRINQNEPTAV